jgi:predicted ribosome quality control (RQC) complex YloA/Tae2 family protein
MDNLVLTLVTRDLHRALRGAILRHLLQEGQHRFRLRLERGERGLAVLISLRPEMPWIGRPTGRWEGVRKPPGPFAARAARTLRGEIVAGVEKPTPDRVVFLRFAQGDTLVAELATHGANLVLLDRDGRVVSAARNPRSARGRIVVGNRYEPPSLPQGLFVPHDRGADDIDAFLRERVTAGEAPLEVLRRHLFGVGTPAARSLLVEAQRRGSSPGTVLRARLDAAAAGDVEPVIEADADPWRTIREGRLDPPDAVLYPWEPEVAIENGRQRFSRDDAAATAGLYHEAIERAAGLRDRLDGLAAILRREARRLEDVQDKVSRDIESFADPDRYRHQAEALLAGLASARRVGDQAFVADPYHPEGALMEVPAPAGKDLTAAADDLFRRHRRAVRGLDAARRRQTAVEDLRERVQWLLVELDRVDTVEGIRKLEAGMREAGIPVGLEVGSRKKGDPVLSRPRLEGVRVFAAADGTLILAGKGGRQNDRLTFKLSGPEDFWLHARGYPGAHVIVRNPERRTHPTDEVLREAAEIAAWYSDAREQGSVEVQWTRRKFVRRLRGAPPGTVKVKRSETVVVRPGLPARGEIGP